MYLLKRAVSALFLSLFCFVAYAQQTVTGTVKDATGEPMIGVTVLADGKAAAVTDFDGNFAVANVTSATVIKVSYVGYKDQEVKVGNQTFLNIVLEEDSEVLDEVVVVGYGTMKKSDLTGSISSVGTDALNAKGAPSVMENLQGTVAGVNITQSSGRAGGDFDIEIRGKSSINSDVTPLYVVDGVMCSDIQFLNPQDIERIDVLKDASSTAIYGSRATAGVVMVTTKSGAGVSREAKPTISYDGYYGITKTTRMPDFMSGEEFAQYRFLKFGDIQGSSAKGNPVYAPTWSSTSGAGQALLIVDDSDVTSESVLKQMLANGQTYNWPDLVTQDGTQQNHYLAVNGGSNSVNYHFGLGYNQEKGIYDGDNQRQISFKGSLDARVNKVVSAGFSMNLAYIDNDYANDDAIKYAYRMNPFMQPYDEDGNVIHQPGLNTTLGTNNHQFTSSINPLDLMKNAKEQRETWRLLGNIYLKFDIIKGLDFKTTFSPSYNNYRDGSFSGYTNPATGLTYDDYDTSTAEATVINYKSFSWTWDNVINYNTTIAEDHNIGLMGLFSMESGDTEKYTWVATGVMENTDWWNMGSGTFNSDDSSSSYSESSLISYALRANYSYKGRYLFTGTVRWDGSSKFADGNRWGCFPSLALAWRVTEENFMQKTSKWLSNLKVRLSYGVTGNNAGIGNYATQQTVSGPVYYAFGDATYQGFYPSSIVNKELQWEKSYEINGGIDFGFFRNRLTGTIDVYQKNSKDLLYSVLLPLVSGGVTMTTNVGKVQNTGVELQMTGVIIQKKDWNWTASITWAHNKNKVKEINGLGESIVSGSATGNLFIGSSVNNLYAYECKGVITDKLMTVPDHEVAIANGFTPGEKVTEYEYYYACYGLSEGQPKIVDRNGDGSFDENDKKIYNCDPVWTGSLNSTLSYKNWDFSFSIYAKINYNAYSNFMSEYLDWGDRGRNHLMVDYYIPAGTLLSFDGMAEDGTFINPVYQETTKYGSYPFPSQAGSSGDGLGGMADYWDEAKCIVDASYVKVKHITLGYTFPKKWLKHISCEHLRLYVKVTNPFCFTDYKGWDPEWADASMKQDGPSTMTWQIGASIKF